ncbi:MAG: rhomboid family intramembrane serine protease [Bacteroidales bacterium]
MENNVSETSVEKRKLLSSALVPLLITALLWLIKIFEVSTGISLSKYGILPQTFKGLIGIITAPLLHADFAHLSANSIPFLFLSWMLFYFYPKKAVTILSLCWVITGFWVWAFAKEGIHIGASGVIYALAGFHFVGGILRRDPKHLAIALVVVFLYGGLVWGIIPDFAIKKNISWESHLLGLIAGIVLAFAYKKEGVQAEPYNWDDDEEVDFDWQDHSKDETTSDSDKENSDNSDENNKTTNDADPQKKLTINYKYVNKSSKTDKNI